MSFRGVLSRVKYWLCCLLPQKTYWKLMGTYKAVPAVTSEYTTVEECLESGKKVVELLDRVAPLSPDWVTLQIGSGLGRVEAHLSARVKRCYGADISPSMVEKAKQLVVRDNVEFRCTDGKGLSSWDDGSLDLIYSFLVFQHLPRKIVRGYLAEALAKLRPGGRLVFQVPLDESGKQAEPPSWHPYGLRYYTRREVGELLRSTGFRPGPLHRFEDGAADDGRALGDVVFTAAKA